VTGRKVTILTGTGHHPFDRLVGWADARARANPGEKVTIQYAASKGPKAAVGVAYLARDDLSELVRKSDVVITHGGPGTIMDARHSGHRPIVLARDPALGEIVDNHQMLFTEWAAARGLIRAVRGIGELESEVAGLGPEGTRDASPSTHSAEDSVRRLKQVLDQFDGRRLPLAADATSVLYVGGPVRGNVTFLKSLLGLLPDVHVLAGVTHVWERGVRANGLCACGDGFSSCAFWGPVGDLAFDGWSKLDINHVLSLKAAVEKERHPLIGTARRHPGARLRKLLIEYSAYYQRIYAAAGEVSGACVVVDSGGAAPTALALSHNRQIDLRMLHVSPGVRRLAHSGSLVGDGRKTSAGEPRLSMKDARIAWLQSSMATGGLAYRGIAVKQIRYEDLLLNAATTVHAAWKSLRLPGEGAVPPLGEPGEEVPLLHSLGASREV